MVPSFFEIGFFLPNYSPKLMGLVAVLLGVGFGVKSPTLGIIQAHS
jgi:hypothetical protein